ncbi:hypothetical protein H6G98_23030 [Nostoc sp. FACHB-857]|nr:hypothetical protein [Nostoc sp. FACHB-857]
MGRQGDKETNYNKSFLRSSVRPWPWRSRSVSDTRSHRQKPTLVSSFLVPMPHAPCPMPYY